MNGTIPKYMVESDFDFASVVLGLHQEYIELDLFNHGLAKFSAEDFEEAGLTAEDRAFIAFMATQEADHATLLTNMLGEAAPRQCTYDYPFTTVREFIDFNVKLTRFGESGTWGFLSHLDSREVGTLLVQAVSIEARQQMAFRQMLGLHPMSVSFVPGEKAEVFIFTMPVLIFFKAFLNHGTGLCLPRTSPPARRTILALPGKTSQLSIFSTSPTPIGA